MQWRARSTSLVRRLLLLPMLLLIAATSVPATSIAAGVTLAMATSVNASEAPALALAMCEQGSSGADTLIDYEYIAKCTWLSHTQGAAEVLLLLLLAALLYLLSSTADSFFCPVLQAIVEKYRIPPDIAGVTFLSFGNGSPDVFSNIAAFSLATPNIGVASILGGGLLVTTVIAACVGLVSEGQEQLIPRKFIRDVTFYFAALVYFCFVCFDGTVHLPEALGFLGLYVCYALVVLFDRKLAALAYAMCGGGADGRSDDDLCDDIEYVSSPHASSRSGSNSSSPRDATLFLKPAYDVIRIRDYHTGGIGTGTATATDAGDMNYDSDSSSHSAPAALHRKSSAPTPRAMQSREPTSTAHERQSLLERTDAFFKRPASVCLASVRQSRRRRRRTAWESVEASAHFGPTARRWTRSYHQLSGIEEFPNSVSETEGEDRLLDDVDEEVDEIAIDVLRTGIAVLEHLVWRPFELATTFARRLTIPLVDDDTWDKNFAVASPPFIVYAIGASAFQLDVRNDAAFVGAIIGGGALLSLAVEVSTSHVQPPVGHRLVPFVAAAFVMSVIWIMNIADELLGVLEALGGLFGISNSVLGVSVLAWGNSIGDLVSNTSIARDGFPTMAFAGCFAGPMFNLLVGIGLALTLAVVTNGPVAMGKPTPLVYLGFGYLFASLALNLGMAALDDFQYRRRLCYALLALYLSFAVISIVVVLSYR